jgi:hypothetical protein
MSPPVRATIQALGLSRTARAMGLPVSTVFRWMREDRIPGRGAAHAWRVARFEAAVLALALAPDGDEGSPP